MVKIVIRFFDRIFCSGAALLFCYRAVPTMMDWPKMEPDLLSASIEAGVSVSYAVRDLSGEVIQPLNAIEGQRYAVVYSFAEGRPVKVLDKEQLVIFGREMARFHNVAAVVRLGGSDGEVHAGPSAEDRWTFDTETTLLRPLRQLEPYYKELEEEYSWLNGAVGQAANRLAGVDNTVVSKGYCHFDFLPKNFHFDGTKITFFDFDFMGYGWLVYDLASFWQHLQLEIYAGRMKQEEADSQFYIFLSSYRQVRALSDEELALIPYLSLGFWLFYMGFHTTHDQFYSALQPSSLKANTAFLRDLAQRHWKP
jgi:Ser/Thr protein kinase RdoA (MazF antagonist)